MTLPELVNPIFLFVVALRRKVARNLSLECGEVKREALSLFAGLERDAATHALTDRWNRAKITLSYLVDEIAIMETWSGAEMWNNHSLEIEYLGHTEKMRGVWFFDKEYKDAIEAGDVDLMEILYTCMCLGFEGKFRGQTAQLKNHIDNLYARLPLPYREQDRDEKMFPLAYKIDLTANDPKMPMRVVTVLTVFFSILVSYFVVTWVMKNEFVGRLATIADILLKGLPES